jgi:hypothetical protein
MGTRSVIKFQEDGETFCAIYQQFDGYPEGVGRELFDFLDSITIVNGLSAGQPKIVANGMGCLAAQFIAEFKDGAGGFYMTHPDDTQEYDYIVNASWEGEGWKAKLGEPTVTVFDHGNEIFSGNVMDFGLFIASINDVEDA